MAPLLVRFRSATVLASSLFVSSCLLVGTAQAAGNKDRRSYEVGGMTLQVPSSPGQLRQIVSCRFRFSCSSANVQQCQGYIEAALIRAQITQEETCVAHGGKLGVGEAGIDDARYETYNDPIFDASINVSSTEGILETGCFWYVPSPSTPESRDQALDLSSDYRRTLFVAEGWLFGGGYRSICDPDTQVVVQFGVD